MWSDNLDYKRVLSIVKLINKKVSSSGQSIHTRDQPSATTRLAWQPHCLSYYSQAASPVAMAAALGVLSDGVG